MSDASDLRLLKGIAKNLRNLATGRHSGHSGQTYAQKHGWHKFKKAGARHYDMSKRGRGKNKGRHKAAHEHGDEPSPRQKKQAGRISVAAVARFLEFGTSKMAARPFITQAFESTKEACMQIIREEILSGIEKLAGK